MALETCRLFDVCEAAQGNNVFFIFDIYRYPEVNDLWEAMRYRNDAKWCYLYKGSYYEGYIERSPIIVQIENGNPGETLFWSLSNVDAAVEDAGLVVVTPENLEQLHQHWLYWINAHQPDEQPIHIPLFNAVIFNRLWQALDNEDRMLLVGNQMRLYQPVRDENSQCMLSELNLSVESSESATQSSMHDSSWYQYSQETLDRLFYPERIESLVQALHQKHFSSTNVSIDALRIRFAEGIELAKQKYKQTTQLDQETFATYRFLLGNRFYEHPGFHRIYGATSLRDRIERFRESMVGKKDELLAYRDDDWL